MRFCWRKSRRPKRRTKKAATPFHAVLNLVNSVLGAGVLGIPYAFAKAGIIPSIIIFVFMVILNYASLSIVCYIADATLVYSYGDVYLCLFNTIYHFSLACRPYFRSSFCSFRRYYNIPPLLWPSLVIRRLIRRLFNFFS